MVPSTASRTAPAGSDSQDLGRYHLTLTADGREMLHGWWAGTATGRKPTAPSPTRR